MLLRSSLAAGVAVLLAGCEPASGPVVLGVAGPFTTGYGASMRQGVELAVREVNDGGGVRGRPLELRFADDEANPDAALRVAESLYEDREVVAVVGHVNSGAMLHASSVYEQGLPAVATSATSAAISRAGDFVFRVAPSDAHNAAELARVAAASEAPTAILYENEDYGRGLADAFHAALAGAGGRVVSVDPYLPRTQDFRPFLERMSARGVGQLLIAGLETEAARIIDQAREVGLEAEILGSHGLEGLVTMGSSYDGTRVGVLYHPQASAEAASFADRFRDAYGREPDSYAALGYDAAKLLAEAIREAGADREAIRAQLARVGRDGQPAFQGVTGTVRFDENGDPVEKLFDVGVIAAGAISLPDGR